MLSKLAESVFRLGRHPEAALLDGDLMSRLIYSALAEMEPAGLSLVRPDESLDLFVTTTDVYGYDTAIPTGAGGISDTDKSFRQLLRFHYDQVQPPDEAESDFSDVAALAFAARATAGFPGAFPPVSLSSFLRALNSQAGTATTASPGQIARYFVYGLDYGQIEKDQWFMDGGVLDNHLPPPRGGLASPKTQAARGGPETRGLQRLGQRGAGPPLAALATVTDRQAVSAFHGQPSQRAVADGGGQRRRARAQQLRIIGP